MSLCYQKAPSKQEQCQCLGVHGADSADTSLVTGLLFNSETLIEARNDNFTLNGNLPHLSATASTKEMNEILNEKEKYERRSKLPGFPDQLVPHSAITGEVSAGRQQGDLSIICPFHNKQ